MKPHEIKRYLKNTGQAYVMKSTDDNTVVRLARRLATLQRKT